MSGEEIVFSLEETNRMRAQLGLAPLEDDDAGESQGKKDSEKEVIHVDPRIEREREEAAKRLDKARRDRLRGQKLTGPTLAMGEDEDEEDGDALEWVVKSKERQAARAAEIAQAEAKRRQRLKQQEYTAQDLTGLAVMHDAEDFEHGETRVLTLADARVLDESGKALNEEADALVDVEKAEKERQERVNERRAGKKSYDVQAALEGKTQSILSQYDEERKKQGLMIESGVATSEEAKQRRLEQIRARLSAGAPEAKHTPTSYDLSSSDLNVASDFYTAEEMAAFKKPKDKKKKRKKKIRKTKIDIDELIKDDGVIDENDADLGSRSAASELSDAAREALAQKRKQEAYDAALAKAAESTLKILQSVEEEEDVVGDDEDFYESLRVAKARIRPAPAKSSSTGTDGGEGDVAELVRSRVKREAVSDDEEEEDDGIMFSETTEFCHNLKVAQEDFEESVAVKTERSEQGMDTEMGVENGNGMDVEESDGAMGEGQGGEKEHGKEKGEEEEEEEEDDGPVGGELLYSGGLAACLQAMRSSIQPLNEQSEVYSGRRTDKKLELDSDPAPGLNLDHRDEFGRLMTPHEAFRKLSHKFHGRPPSKNKQEKMRQRHEEEMKRRTMGKADTPLQTTSRIQEKLKDAQQPFMVVNQKNSKPMFSEVLEDDGEAAGAEESVEQGPEVGFRFKRGKLNKKKKPKPKKRKREDEAPQLPAGYTGTVIPPPADAFESSPFQKQSSGYADQQPRSRPRYY
eukprot:TRINITY_DN4157_c0_g1_i1.p1 TRINITY_DN4157_c0_g1~~TRINITY_DN4157_c0_g1_i1.p1  ORF type:complete len:745 (-),score=292.16 TRINITY_DN4157_c0_g1_i1:75-2309(-)